MAMFKDLPTFAEYSNNDNTDPYEHENKLQTKHLQKLKKKVPVYILSPIVNIVWLYLCAPFRAQMDFKFDRSPDWTDDTPVLRFNDTKYVSMHNIFDWHDFALLRDSTLLYPSLLVKVSPTLMYYIDSIKYEMPDNLKNLQPDSDKSDILTQNFWKCEAWMSYKHVNLNVDQWKVCRRKYRKRLKVTDKYTIVNIDDLQHPLVDFHNNPFTIPNVRQHPDVQRNNPFFFSILGFDKYHHTSFTGKHDWDTHGLYWWFGNISSHCQFTKKMTMITSQVPNCVPLHTSAKLAFKHWSHLISSGVSIWHGNEMIQAYGMVSHQMADMQDRDILLRRRGNNKYSRCDGMVWLGYLQGVAWPDQVSDLMELDIVTPGPYLAKLLKHIHEDLTQRGCWTVFPDDYGKVITLTKVAEDIYDYLPLATSLKSTIELNHTTLLGCLTKMFKLQWYNMHMAGNLNVSHTRHVMRSYLCKYFHQINGVKSQLIANKTKMTVFNQMQHAWQKMIEVLICLPACVNWYYNLNIVVAMVRLTGLLFTIKTENERKNVQNLVKIICNAS